MAVNTQRVSPLERARARRLALPRYLRLDGSRYLLGLVLILSLMSLIVLAQTGVVATRGYAIANLEDQRTALLRERTVLQERQARAQSLEQIRRRAEQIGLRPMDPEQARYLDIPAVGGAQPLPDTPPAPAAQAETQ